jgi:hypothetical protein
LAETINTMLAGEIRLTSSYNLTVTDSASPGGRTVTVAAGYYRTFLGDVANGDGTQATPYETLSTLEALLNAAGPGSGSWTVALTSAGFVRITYAAPGTGAASIAWDGTGVVRDVLGYTATATFSAPGQSSTASYHPSHCLYSICRANDSDWTEAPPQSAFCEVPGGQVVGWQDASGTMVRSFDLRFHPKDWATRTSRGSAGTPMLPAKARWSTSGTAAGTDPPWSVKDFVRAAAGKRVGFTDQFQALVAATTGEYDVVYLADATIKADRAMVPTIPQLSALYDFKGFAIRWNASATRES